MSSRFSVVCFDQRGAGHSTPIRGPFRLEQWVDDLGALIDALSLDGPVHLAGVALGSAIAVRFTALRPERVASLVLCCPALNVSHERKAYLTRRAALVETEGMSAIVDDTLAKSFPPVLNFDRARFEAYRARYLETDPASYAAINRAFVTFDVRPDLKSVRCPALVLGGIHDLLRPPAEVSDAAAGIRGAKCTFLPSGHIMPYQTPDALAREMNAFYDEVLIPRAAE
jgi:3-oxoadipate enol-lactonase